MYVQERYTSQSCPKYQCQTYNAGEKIAHRIKYCVKCNTLFNRDTMAGENMARIAISELQGQGRPHDLDGNYIYN